MVFYFKILKEPAYPTVLHGCYGTILLPIIANKKQ